MMVMWCVFLDFVAGFICRGLQSIQVAGAKTWIGQGSFLLWFFMGSGRSLWPCLDLKISEAMVYKSHSLNTLKGNM